VGARTKVYPASRTGSSLRGILHDAIDSAKALARTRSNALPARIRSPGRAHPRKNRSRSLRRTFSRTEELVRKPSWQYAVDSWEKLEHPAHNRGQNLWARYHTSIHCRWIYRSQYRGKNTRGRNGRQCVHLCSEIPGTTAVNIPCCFKGLFHVLRLRRNFVKSRLWASRWFLGHEMWLLRGPQRKGGKESRNSSCIIFSRSDIAFTSVQGPLS